MYGFPYGALSKPQDHFSANIQNFIFLYHCDMAIFFKQVTLSTNFKIFRNKNRNGELNY